MEDLEGLVASPSLVNSAVDAMLPVLWEEVVERPRDVAGDLGEGSSSFDSAMMARVNKDSRRGFGGALDFLYMGSAWENGMVTSGDS